MDLHGAALLFDVDAITDEYAAQTDRGSFPELEDGLRLLANASAGLDPKLDVGNVFRVTNGIFISGLEAAKTLANRDAFHRVTLLADSACIPGYASCSEMSTVLDAPLGSGFRHSAPTVAAILQALRGALALAKQRSVLVHCHMGFSRSASAVLVMLMAAISATYGRSMSASQLFSTAAAMLATATCVTQEGRRRGKYTAIQGIHYPLLAAVARTFGRA